jgi:hypothetical protein
MFTDFGEVVLVVRIMRQYEVVSNFVSNRKVPKNQSQQLLDG